MKKIKPFDYFVLALCSLMLLTVGGTYVFSQTGEFASDSAVSLRPTELPLQRAALHYPEAKLRPKSFTTQETAVRSKLSRDLPSAQTFNLGVASGLGRQLRLADFEISETTEQIPIDYGTYYEESDELLLGEEVVVQEGVNGLIVVQNRVTLRNGEVFKVEEMGRSVLQAAQDRIIRIGTARAETEAASAATTIEAETEAETEATLAADAETVSEREAGSSMARAMSTAASIFAQAGSNHAATENLNLLQTEGLLQLGAERNDPSTLIEADGLLSLGGHSFRVRELGSSPVTAYDGLQCCLVAGDHNPPINHLTASGIPAQRGLCAVAPGYFPMGTVLFVEGYGFAVVADIHGMGGRYPDLIDLCFEAGACSEGGLNFGFRHLRIFVVE